MQSLRRPLAARLLAATALVTTATGALWLDVSGLAPQSAVSGPRAGFARRLLQDTGVFRDGKILPMILLACIIGGVIITIGIGCCCRRCLVRNRRLVQAFQLERKGRRISVISDHPAAPTIHHQDVILDHDSDEEATELYDRPPPKWSEPEHVPPPSSGGRTPNPEDQLLGRSRHGLLSDEEMDVLDRVVEQPSSFGPPGRLLTVPMAHRVHAARSPAADDPLACPLCCNGYDKASRRLPRQLPCGHRICSVCERFIPQEMVQLHALARVPRTLCPFCREPFSELDTKVVPEIMRALG
eukprot:tig00021275_g19871.t1